MWEECSANWSDALKAATPVAGIGQQKGPSSSPRQHVTMHHTTNASQAERFGLGSFASFAMFTWALTNQVLLLQASWQLFAGKTLPQPAGGRKRFLKVGWIPKHRFLCYRISKFTSCWQKCVDCNGSYFDFKKTCLSLVIMIKIHGSKLQLHLYQPDRKRKKEDWKKMGKPRESLVKAPLKERPLSFNKTSWDYRFLIWQYRWRYFQMLSSLNAYY